MVGINNKTLESWERGRSQPRPEVIKALSTAWGFPLDWFWDARQVGLPPGYSGAAILMPKDSDEITKGIIYGKKCLIRQWRGANAGTDNEELSFDLVPEEAYAIWGWVVDGKPDIHDSFRISGESMSPRIEHGDRVIVRIEPDPPYGAIVAAQSPAGQVFFKVFRRGAVGPELHSINPKFSPILDLHGWECKGFAIAIIKEPDGNRGFSLEWLEGLPLRP